MPSKTAELASLTAHLAAELEGTTHADAAATAANLARSVHGAADAVYVALHYGVLPALGRVADERTAAINDKTDPMTQPEETTPMTDTTPDTTDPTATATTEPTATTGRRYTDGGLHTTTKRVLLPGAIDGIDEPIPVGYFHDLPIIQRVGYASDDPAFDPNDLTNEELLAWILSDDPDRHIVTAVDILRRRLADPRLFVRTPARWS